MPEARVKIWGPNWDRACKDKRVLARWQGRSLLGKEFSKAVKVSRLNLNQVDLTNGPGANMRFFEIPMSGGVQLASHCPEMEDAFVDGRDILYYRSADDAARIVRDAMSGKFDLEAIRRSSRALVTKEHTYQARARFLLAAVAKVEAGSSATP